MAVERKTLSGQQCTSVSLKGKFKSCNSLKDVEGHHHGNAKHVGDLNLLPEVAQATTFNQAQVLQEEEEEKRSQQPKVLPSRWFNCLIGILSLWIDFAEPSREISDLTTRALTVESASCCMQVFA